MTSTNIYDSNRVKNLFNEMSSTYGLMNLITSFGFTYFWRKACIRSIQIRPDDTVIDLMTGMGELFSQINKFLGPKGQLMAVDFSSAMCKKARGNAKLLNLQITVLEADVLTFEFENSSADVVTSSFGLKTFSDFQLKDLAKTTFDVLKPGGQFSFVEISVPKIKPLKVFYLFYLKIIIPLLGKIFLGNPENYRQLGIYTVSFGSCTKAEKYFRDSGLDTKIESFFWGCATCISGSKPKVNSL